MPASSIPEHSNSTPLPTAEKLAIDKATKEYDIYGNPQKYKWHPDTGSDELYKNIPYVQLNEYQNMTDIQLQQILFLSNARRFNGISRNVSFEDLYDGMYQIKPTGRNFKFPYFNEYPFSITSTYSQIDLKPLVETLAGKGINVSNWIRDAGINIEDWAARTGNALDAAINGSYGVMDQIRDTYGQIGWEHRYGVTQAAQTIKSWTSAESGQYETKFTLINDNDELALNHYKFIRMFMLALAPKYPNVTTVIVPFLYTIRIPSVVTIPLGFIGKFSATPKGYSHISKNGNSSLVIPEAWEINMTFNSLFPVSQQTLNLIDLEDGVMNNGITSPFTMNNSDQHNNDEIASTIDDSKIDAAYGTPK